jgi:hypothetical protein
MNGILYNRVSNSLYDRLTCAPALDIFELKSRKEDIHRIQELLPASRSNVLSSSGPWLQL